MQPGVSFHDYLLRDENAPDRDAKLVFTGAMQLSSLPHAPLQLLGPPGRALICKYPCLTKPEKKSNLQLGNNEPMMEGPSRLAMRRSP